MALNNIVKPNLVGLPNLPTVPLQYGRLNFSQSDLLWLFEWSDVARRCVVFPFAVKDSNAVEVVISSNERDNGAYAPVNIESLKECLFLIPLPPLKKGTSSKATLIQLSAQFWVSLPMAGFEFVLVNNDTVLTTLSGLQNNTTNTAKVVTYDNLNVLPFSGFYQFADTSQTMLLDTTVVIGDDVELDEDEYLYFGIKLSGKSTPLGGTNTTDFSYAQGILSYSFYNQGVTFE
jgi:hypothetical protein